MDLCAGGAVGAAFSELQTVLLNVIKTIHQFKSTLNRLDATVKSISLIVKDIKKFDTLLERPQEEIDMFTDRLKKGTDLIRLCNKIKFWNLYKKYSYSKKLQSFDTQLVRFFQIDVQAHQVRGLSRISMGVSDLSEKLDWVRNDILHDVNEKLDSMRLSSLSNISGSSSSSSCGRMFSASSWVGDLPELILGLDLPLLEVKAMLLNDDTPVVLLSAPPGCGKTTLAKMLCSDPDIIGNFKNILSVTVSKTVNIKVIVQKIFQQRGCLHELLEVQSDQDAIDQLAVLLRRIGGKLDEGPTLLTLDDVWSPELEYLIQKFSFKKIPGYKLLVTTRFDPPGLQTVYRLKLLNHQDATLLFRHQAFPPESSHPRVSNDIVNEVVKACKGFPLALNVVALSLRGKSEVNWRATLDKWSKRRSSIFDSCSELLNNLKTSLDDLDEENDKERLKDCFLDLGSFPEDQRIPVTVLLDMWVELYELDEEGMYTYEHIDELATRNFLNLVPMRKDDSCDLDSFCNGQYVTLHDMLRELAIHQCSQQDVGLRERLIIETVRNSPPGWLNKSLKQPLHARLVSISTDDSFTSNWWDMQLPEAEVLILNLRSRNYTLPRFIKAIDRLKVLIVLNYGFGLAKLDNFPVIGFISNLKRIRLEHVSISSTFDNTVAAFKLMNLQKISLTMCEIGNALDNCADMFPNLVEIEIEYCRDLVKLPAGLCDCVLIKKASITSCNELGTLPEEIGKLINLQSLRLNSCTRLEEIPETIGCLQELNLLDISDCLSLSELPKQIGDLRGLRTLHMRGCWGLFELPLSVEELKCLTVLCDKQTAALWKFYRNVDVVIVKEDINLNWLHN